jgi:hypothetical protein
VFDNYTDMDRLILERWSDVVGLIDAHRAAQDHIEAALEAAGERVIRWVREQGFDGEMRPRDAELHTWRPSWYDKRKGESKVLLTLGGLCPVGFRRVDEAYPFLWVMTHQLADFKIKEPERVKLAHSLRLALGDAARSWDDAGVDDADHPLGRYLRQYDNDTRARLLLNPDSLVDFCKEHLPALFALADTIEAELQKLTA